MSENLDTQLTDPKKDETTRRIELGMLGLLVEKYPFEAREKLQKQTAQTQNG